MNDRHFFLWPALIAVTLMAPPTLHAQNPVTPICMDGTRAPGSNPTGCAQHGGVDYVATNAAGNARAGATQDTTHTVVCIDGSNAPAGPAACKGHRGIDSVATRAALKARGGQGAGAAPTKPESAGMDTAGARSPGAGVTRDTAPFRRDST
jgi:hypothetical protein